ncbi:MAG: GTP-binding protein [Oceanicoccus sp.]|jgi:GTP-binding protein
MSKMFFDEVSLHVEGGKGGNGVVSFHREKFVACGPPDGGTGGNGGNVIILADSNFNTFQKYSGTKTYKGEIGVAGHKNNMTGATGENVILKVPLGTLVQDEHTGELIVDLKNNGDSFIIARGGRGGKGNANFASSTRQAPNFCEIGDIGEERDIRLEMQLVADVGLVGFPSAGKSTLISHVSSAKPKIGDYPFTTIIPNLGVVFLSDFNVNSDENFVIADMPGIIEGASEGKGLGDAFLKHISRTASLVFLLDPFAYDDKTMAEQYKILKNEIETYKPGLLDKEYFVAMNKIDAIPDEDRKELKEAFLKEFPKEKDNFYMLSGVSGENLRPLILDLWKTTKEAKPDEVEEEVEESTDYQPYIHVDDQSYKISKLYDVESTNFEPYINGKLISDASRPTRALWKVEGQRIEQIARMTNMEQEGALHRIYDILKKTDIHNALIREGVTNGDYVKIAWHIIEFHDLQQ